MAELDSEMVIEGMETENGGQDGKGKKSWKMWRKTAGGKVTKRKKKTTLEKSLKLKKYVQPKNAVMCLHELIPGVIFNVEQEGKAPNNPTQVSVTVEGQKYHGFGSSKQMAKQAAAEAALVSFVKPPPPAGSGTTVQDTTPWAVLASFAMFKLFNEWREGRFGVSPINANPFGGAMMPPDAMSQTFQALLGASMPTTTTSGEMESSIAHLNMFSSNLTSKSAENNKGESKAVPNPAKQVPENAASIHPIMLLHQMKPNIQYVPSSVTVDNKKVFSMKAVIDNQTFVGEGMNAKKAKMDLAIKANKALFGVVTLYNSNS